MRPLCGYCKDTWRMACDACQGTGDRGKCTSCQGSGIEVCPLVGSNTAFPFGPASHDPDWMRRVRSLSEIRHTESCRSCNGSGRMKYPRTIKEPHEPFLPEDALREQGMEILCPCCGGRGTVL